MASDSSDIFLYLNDLYDLLPDSDQIRFGETWKAYEQTYGSIWMNLFEFRLGIHIDDCPLYNDKRWLFYTFDNATEAPQAAQYRSNQDLSLGLNLSNVYLIRFSIDGGPQIEVNLQGPIPSATTGAQIVSAINTAAGFKFASLVVGGALLNFTSSTAGPTSTITFYAASQPSHDASAVILGLAPADLPITTPQYPYTFQLGDTTIVGIPTLQDRIHDNGEPDSNPGITNYLSQDTDFIIQFGTGLISFLVPPPVDMWAKDTLVNNETPYNNFGFLMGIYAQNTPAYLKSLKGLWFAFWTGPRPENIQRALYLLFDLPAASLAGTVTTVSATSITVTYTDNTTETFAVPPGLYPIVAAGDPLTRFQPLVNGIVVLDKINSPGFIAREVGRPGVQQFLTQFASRGLGDTDETKALTMVEQNTYLPQIDVNAFTNSNISLANVRTFLTNIQPKSRTFLFQILVGNFNDILEFFEFTEFDIDMDVTPNVDSNPNTYAQQSDLDNAEVNDLAGMTLDSEVMMFYDQVHVDVYYGVTLVDSFDLTG